jgi:hypothetical protein
MKCYLIPIYINLVIWDILVHNVTVDVSVACVEVAKRPFPRKLIASIYSFNTYTIKISYHLFKIKMNTASIYAV